MDTVKQYFFANIIIVTVVGASLLAVIFPSAGKYLDQFNLITPLIIIVFICQGTGVQKLESANFKKYGTALVVGFLISQIIAPVLGFLCIQIMDWKDDSMVGFMLICSMAPTPWSLTPRPCRATA